MEVIHHSCSKLMQVVTKNGEVKNYVLITFAARVVAVVL